MGERAAKVRIPDISEVPEGERNGTVELLLEVCRRQAATISQQQEVLEQQAERIHDLEETVACLKDEIAVLKGEKGRPKLKPSTLNQREHQSQGNPESDERAGSGKSQKTKELEIPETTVIHPAPIPAGSVFKGYEDYVVQGIRIKLHNTRYRRARYQTPTGEYIVGELPEGVRGSHFDPELRSYVLSQYYQQHVPQGLILKQLWEFGVQISAGQLNRIITEGHGRFHEEKQEILRVGLEVSRYVNVDDTAARHQGQNGYCTPIGNELFAWFSSTESKNRINFLELLRAAHPDSVVDGGWHESR